MSTRPQDRAKGVDRLGIDIVIVFLDCTHWLGKFHDGDCDAAADVDAAWPRGGGKKVRARRRAMRPTCLEPAEGNCAPSRDAPPTPTP